LLGEKLKKKMIGVSFKPANDGFFATVAFGVFTEADVELTGTLQKASEIYEICVKELRVLKQKHQALLKARRNIPIHLMWDFGDNIFKLVWELEKLNLFPESLYKNLSRDLGYSVTTIGRQVSLRRYISNKEIIPSDIKWSFCKDSPKRFALWLNEKKTNTYFNK